MNVIENGEIEREEEEAQKGNSQNEACVIGRIIGNGKNIKHS